MSLWLPFRITWDFHTFGACLTCKYSCNCDMLFHLDIICMDSLAEWSKALAPGASPQGRGFEPHSCHFSSTHGVWHCYWFAWHFACVSGYIDLVFPHLKIRCADWTCESGWRLTHCESKKLPDMVSFSSFENLLCQVDFWRVLKHACVWSLHWIK